MINCNSGLWVDQSPEQYSPLKFMLFHNQLYLFHTTSLTPHYVFLLRTHQSKFVHPERHWGLFIQETHADGHRLLWIQEPKLDSQPQLLQWVIQSVLSLSKPATLQKPQNRYCLCWFVVTGCNFSTSPVWTFALAVLHCALETSLVGIYLEFDKDV